MNLETIRLVSQLRQEFYSLFAAEMDVPVKITNRNSCTGSLSTVFWLDSRHCLNYLCIFAHLAPDDLIPERPLVLRVAVNKSGDLMALSKHKKSNQALNQKWNLELILLPEEILEFLPWIISLIKSYDTNSTKSLSLPPHPLACKSSVKLPLVSIKTQQASKKLAQPQLVYPA